jgi:hypothetical protein
MLVVTLVALSLLGQWPHRQTVVHVERTGDWTTRITHDTFTGQTSCSLAKHDIHFERDSLVFYLGRRSDIGDADFRIDDGPARSVREASLDDDRRGFFRDGGPIDNPSDGKVVLPSSYMTGAKLVYIRISPRYQPRVFDISRFEAALAAARAAGCGESAF